MRRKNDEAGEKAQRNGANFEKVIESLSSLKGFEVVKYSRYKKEKKYYDTLDKLIIQQPLCPMHMDKKGKKGRQDFLLRITNPDPISFYNNYFQPNNEGVLEICVQCKFQISQGSTDEKISHLGHTLELREFIYKNVILLHHGNGIRQQYLDVMTDDSRRYKREGSYNFKVMDLNEFNNLVKLLDSLNPSKRFVYSDLF